MRLPTVVDAFDGLVDRLFEPLRGRRSTDRVAYVASELADYSVGWHLLNLAVAVIRPGREAHAVRMAVTLGVESALVNGAIKPLFKRERPDGWEDVATLQVRRPRTASFPSGHASSGAVAAILLSNAAPTLRPVWWAAAGVVAGSRIYTRMHHASDVVAGAAVGTIIGVLAKRLVPLR
ncbi:MAG: phosphatase PAP2 family protein [Actinomycetota bacterium]|nr:phosphatase PAP2 family protein [Actinomycetota bacterium]